MLGWFRRVFPNPASQPERQERAADLDAKEREVRAQTAQIRRIRAEARLAELRFKSGR